MKSIFRSRFLSSDQSEERSRKVSKSRWRTAEVGKKEEPFGREIFVPVDPFPQEPKRLSYHSRAEDRVAPMSSSSRLRATLRSILKGETYDRNDVTVLTLGLNQYLEEVFRVLDHDNRGYLERSDLNLLCQLLNKKSSESVPDEIYSCSSSCEQSNEECSNSNCQKHVRGPEFLQILTKLFVPSSEPDLILRSLENNSKLVETIVSVSRRTASLHQISVALGLVENIFQKLVDEERAQERIRCCERNNCLDANDNYVTCMRARGLHMQNCELHKMVLVQLQEVQCLREIIEDLRVALQSCDAENLALRVRQEKMQKQIHKCFCHQDKSFPDEQDSIDQLIINFPSNEQLLNCDSSYPNEHSDSKSEQNSSELIRCLELEQDLSATQQLLNEAKLELTGAKNSLNLTRDNQREREVNFGEIESQLREQNVHLNDQISFMKNKFIVQETNQEFLQSELNDKLNECHRLKTELEVINNSRKRDLDLLRNTRSLLAKSLVETSNTEKSLRILKQTAGSHTTIEPTMQNRFIQNKSQRRELPQKNHSTSDIIIVDQIMRARKRSATERRGFDSKMAKVEAQKNELQEPGLRTGSNEILSRREDKENINSTILYNEPKIQEQKQYHTNFSKSYVGLSEFQIPKYDLKITKNASETNSDSQQTSTQILESLEAQVEMLRKSLDEDCYGIN